MLIQIEVEFQDVDPGFAKYMERPRLDMLGHYSPELVHGHAPRFGDSRQLEFGISRSNVRIEA